MSKFISGCLVGLYAFLLIPTSSETCVEHRAFELVYSGSTPSEVASGERNTTSIYDCAELCTKLFSEHCDLFFYNTRTRHCSVYDSSIFCVSLRNQPDTNGYAYTRTPSEHVGECPVGSRYIQDLVNSDGWLVIQRRTDGSENFDRSWIDYENGFGSFLNEFWLGNKYIHGLTKYRRYEIQFDVEAQDGKTGFRRFSLFFIGSAADKYKLHIGATSTGNIEEHLHKYHSGLNFSTKDQDNDQSTTFNCAKIHGAGWWYGPCGLTMLNSRPPCSFKSSGHGFCSRWYTFGKDLKRTQMKIRPA